MNKPKIRFKEFADDWEQRKVSEIATITAGGTPSTSKSEYWNPKEIPWLSSGEVNKKYIFKTDNMISQDGLKNSSAKWIEEGSVLIALAGQGKTRGTVAIARIPMTTNQSIAALKFDETVYPDYAFHNLDSRYDELRSISSGDGTRGGLNKQLLSKLEILIPTYKEQKQIGLYFSNLDNLITLHQDKCNQLKEYKKYMLQNMFPQEGEKTPRIRYKGFKDDWEQRKVSELCSISTGKSNTQDNVEDGKYPFYVRSPIIERSDKYLYDEEAVLTVGDGVGTGKVFHYVNGKYDLHQRVYRMYNFSDELYSKYFYHYFSKNFYKRVMSMTAKTSVDSVRMEMIADMSIYLPKRLEQIKIGDYLDHIDNLITLHQRKCENLKEIKKYMLQNMFI